MVGRKKDAAALVSTLDILIPMRGNRGSDPCELDKFLVIKYKYWLGSSHTDTLHDARGKEVTYGGGGGSEGAVRKCGSARRILLGLWAR